MLGGVLASCDNAVDPLVEDGAHVFAVFGYLDTAADTQFVRISRLQGESIFSDADAAHPAVASTDVETGETAVWSDSLVSLADGSLALIYYADLDIRPGARYVLEVADEGEPPTRAFTTVPAAIGLLAGEPRRDFMGDLEQTIVWSGIRRGRNTHVHYHVRTNPTGADTTVAVTYRNAGDVISSGWLVNVTLQRDYRVVRNLVRSAIGDTALVLIDVSMSIESPSEEWSQTQESTNIENGTGFFASIARLRENWPLDSAAVRSIGFELP